MKKQSSGSFFAEWNFMDWNLLIQFFGRHKTNRLEHYSYDLRQSMIKNSLICIKNYERFIKRIDLYKTLFLILDRREKWPLLKIFKFYMSFKYVIINWKNVLTYYVTRFLTNPTSICLWFFILWKLSLKELTNSSYLNIYFKTNKISHHQK
jgi:hypothetical protein